MNEVPWMISLVERLKRLGIVPFGTDTFAPALSVEIEELERRIGFPLPDSYRFVLLNYGECTFANEVIFKGEDGARYQFGFFFGFRSIMENLDSPPDDLSPNWLMPIGDEGLGNLYCFRILGNHLEKVFYWNHEVGWGEEAERYLQQGVP